MVSPLANFVQQLSRRHYATHVLQDHFGVYLKLVRVISLVQRCARKLTTPGAIDKSVEDYLQAFQHLYGEDDMMPKFHFMCHMGEFFQKHHQLPSCFVHERKHRAVKRFQADLKNVDSGFGDQVLKSVTNQHLATLVNHSLTHFDLVVGLIGARDPPRLVARKLDDMFGDCSHLQIAKEARINAWERIHTNDAILFAQHCVGKVEYLVTGHCVVQVINIVEDNSRCWKRQRSSALMLVPFDQVICALIWADGGTAGVSTVLKPLHAVQYAHM